MAWILRSFGGDLRLIRESIKRRKAEKPTRPSPTKFIRLSSHPEKKQKREPRRLIPTCWLVRRLFRQGMADPYKGLVQIGWPVAGRHPAARRQCHPVHNGANFQPTDTSEPA